MSSLSPQFEAFISQQLAAGTYSSREKVIEAGLEVLQRIGSTQQVPAAHMAMVEEALQGIAAHGTEEVTDAHWQRLHKLVDDLTAQN